MLPIVCFSHGGHSDLPWQVKNRCYCINDICVTIRHQSAVEVSHHCTIPIPAPCSFYLNIPTGWHHSLELSVNSMNHLHHLMAVGVKRATLWNSTSQPVAEDWMVAPFCAIVWSSTCDDFSKCITKILTASFYIYVFKSHNTCVRSIQIIYLHTQVVI